jgi:DNA ligase-1
VLFALSLDYVGDLAETVALIWPPPKAAPHEAAGQRGSEATEDRGSARSRKPPEAAPLEALLPTSPPRLGEIVETLSATSAAPIAPSLARWLDVLDAPGRWALIKLISGGLRVGVSRRLAEAALAEMGGADPRAVEEA